MMLKLPNDHIMFTMEQYLFSLPRSWQYVYVVQRGPQLWFYESKEHCMQGRTYDGEGPMDLKNAIVLAAPDYSKRKHVFRVM